MRIISTACIFCLTLLLSFHHTAHAEEFTVQPGDILQVTVWKEEGMDREVLVLPDGTITFPLIGTVMIKDMPLLDVQSTIKSKLEPSIPNAPVTVSVKSPLGHKVSILGQVRAPGEVIMNTSMSVMQAFSQVGGLTDYADKGKIIIIRKEPEGKTSIKYPYNDIAQGRNLDKDIDLKSGDVIFVPTSGLF